MGTDRRTPFAFVASGERILFYLVPPVCLVMTFIFGRWTGNRVESRYGLHGTLAGVLAAGRSKRVTTDKVAGVNIA